MTVNALGNYVRERRQDLNLSQEQLAARVGGNCCQSDISRIERGHVELPRFPTMVSLASALEVSVGNLLISSGWFQDGHFPQAPAPGVPVVGSSLKNVLSEIDTELEAIRDLERRAAIRSQQLRRKIREMQVSTGLSVSLAGSD